MLVPPEPVTLITVVHPTQGAFLERFPRVLKMCTAPSWVAKHWIVINPIDEMSDAERRDFEQHIRALFDFSWPVNFVVEPHNRWDLPAFNDLSGEIDTDWWIAVAPDVRIFSEHWIEEFFNGLDANQDIGMVGPEGPGHGVDQNNMRTHAWGWVALLLEDRGIPFDDCQHVQTWCFMMRQAAFKATGGFWERPNRQVQAKGDLIAAEVEMGVRMRKAGYSLNFTTPMLYHYGAPHHTTMAQIEQTDRDRKFTVI